MSDFITVEFPLSPASPTRVYSATYRQQHNEHDYARITFREWGISPSQVKPGSLMRLYLDGKEMVGYVHEIRSKQDSKQHLTEVVFIGASYVMRQASQELYVNMTADQIVRKIAIKYGFSYKVVPHPRVYPQVSQAGMTDWELMVRLAKQCGYYIRAENTSLYFQPVLQEYNDYISEALSFSKVDAGNKSAQALYEFRPIVGETLSHHGADKSATSIAGVDPRTGVPFKYTNQIRNTTNRQIFQHEFFDKHATEVVANDFATAVQEAISADSKSSFPYIADTLVTGMSQLRPGIPLHLDGVGDEYSGYWTVLNVEHEITESSINRYMFNSRVTVGTDSLGAPINTGVPLKPGDIPTRNLNPSIRNTVLKPKNLINNPVVAVKPITTVSLVSRMNRNNITGVTGSMATWTSDLGDLTAPAATATGYSPVIAKAAKYYATH